jgi:lipopolysaccharide biosynthesis regulator YciM
MGAALVLLLVGLGAMAAGVLIGRYYVPDDRQLRRTARHARSYMRAISHLIARDTDTVIDELKTVVEENIEDVEPYFALGAMFRTRGEHERAIRVHQALALRERDRRKVRHRALYELGLDFRAAGMPRRATKAMEEVLLDEPGHEGALRALASLYEEQARFNEAAGLWKRLGTRRGEDTSKREHHLLVAAAQAACARDDLESAKLLLKSAQKLAETPHFYAAAAELAAARKNFRGTKERLRQALLADPALVPHLLPGLIAAEEGIDGGVAKPREDELAESDEENESTLVPGALQLAEGTQPESNALATLQRGLAKPEHEGRANHGSVALVPDDKPSGSVSERVLATLAEIEAQTGPRLEIALIRAQLGAAASPASLDGATPGSAELIAATARADLAGDLTTRFPEALAARVATARVALASGDDRAIKQALDALAGERGALAWALRGRWQCANCGNRPGQFSWRCGQCRRWGTLRMETGVEPPPVQARERRELVRTARPDGLLGAAPDSSLPVPTLDPGLTEDELRMAGSRQSLLGRVGGWFSNRLRRNP